MTSIGSPSPFFLAGKKAYAVDRSLRINDNDTAYLRYTPSSTSSDRKTWTWSSWIKRGNLSLGAQATIFHSYGSGNQRTELTFETSDTIRFAQGAASSGGSLITTAKFRDVNAWYHIMCVADCSNSTAADRLKIYVNGVEQTDFGTQNNAADSNTQMPTSSVPIDIGSRGGSNRHFDGYMAEINFIDGQALTPSSFAETDSTTGQWNPKKYTGSYGTNGFYLNFSDNSGTTATTLGKDSSGNGNNFTPNNFSVAAGAGNDSLEDTPTNNFPTINPLAGYLTTFEVPANGNLDFSFGNDEFAFSTFEIPTSGKWYAEVVFTTVESGRFGITNQNIKNSVKWNGIEYDVYLSGSIAVDNSVVQSSLGAIVAGNIGGIQVDRDAGTVVFTINGTAKGTAVNISSLADSSQLVFTVSRGSSSGSAPVGSINFGQRPFSHLPTGYKALCSANLPDPTIKLPNKHFGIILYTGNNTDDRDITDSSAVNFTPDWLWIKERSGTESHLLFNSVVGTSDFQNSNTNGAQGNDPNALQAFNSNGFQIGTSSELNANSETYVAWNWNAGDTDGKTYTVKVHDFSGNSRYIFDNFQTQAVTLDLAEGGTYIFNMDDASNASHPFSIGTAANGTVYTSGITYFLDGVSKTYSEYTSGFAAASTRRLHITVPASAPVLYYWCSAHSGMGGQVNTNSTLGSSNFDGNIQSVVKANTTAGFSIVKWTTTANAYKTVGHGLGVKPQIVIMKRRDSTNNWATFFDVVDGTNDYVYLNLSNATENAQDYSIVPPTSTVFGTDGAFVGGAVGATMIAYVFSEVSSYSKFGSYKGNGNAEGTFVFTGFRVAFLITKRINQARDWIIYDNKRGPFNEVDNFLEANNSNAEDPKDMIDFVSNGFKLRDSDTDVNENNSTYLYLAFAESPFKYARAR